jgi:hyperosmotically inducible protein
VLPISQTDSDLRVRVAQAIYNNSAFWAYAAMPRPSIHIIVEGGRVMLTGSVNSEVDRSLAYALAQVPGAFEVKNNLRIDR